VRFNNSKSVTNAYSPNSICQPAFNPSRAPRLPASIRTIAEFDVSPHVPSAYAVLIRTSGIRDQASHNPKPRTSSVSEPPFIHRHRRAPCHPSSRDCSARCLSCRHTKRRSAEGPVFKGVEEYVVRVGLLDGKGSVG
jgi:hypothetical protein